MRAREACEPCRERKRKCDGTYPCTSCIRFEYACHYVSVRRTSKKETAALPSAAPPPEARLAPLAMSDDSEVSQLADNQLQYLEANSGAVSIRKLALALDPANAPRSNFFARNLFLGGRTSDYYPRGRSIAEIISRTTMESLTTTYLDNVDPCCGFVITIHFGSACNLAGIHTPLVIPMMLCSVVLPLLDSYSPAYMWRIQNLISSRLPNIFWGSP
jgi:hypothetical protein